MKIKRFAELNESKTDLILEERGSEGIKEMVIMEAEHWEDEQHWEGPFLLITTNSGKQYEVDVKQLGVPDGPG